MGIKVGSQNVSQRPPAAAPRQLPNSNVRVARPQAPAAAQRALSPSIRVRRPDPGAGHPQPMKRSAQSQALATHQQATAQEYQKMGQQALAGNAPAQANATQCISCGAKVTPRVDALTLRDGSGPYCPQCWAHTWIDHTYRNLDGGPPCKMGVRFTDPEWRAIQSAIAGVIRDIGARTGRFPAPAEMDVVLREFKFSQVCFTCKGNIAYTLDSSNFQIAGVNVPWPPGKPVPWAVPGR